MKVTISKGTSLRENSSTVLIGCQLEDVATMQAHSLGSVSIYLICSEICLKYFIIRLEIIRLKRSPVQDENKNYFPLK